MADGRRRRDEDDERSPRPAKRARGTARRAGRPPSGSARGTDSAGRDGAPRRGGRPAPRAGAAHDAHRDDERRGPRSQARQADSRRRTGRSDARGRGERRDGRTSRSSDERNPTRSGIQYPSRKVRRPGEEPAAEPPKRAVLRTVRGQPPKPKVTRERKAAPAKARPPRRRRKVTEALDELARLAGRGAAKAQDQLTRAGDAYGAGRERDALRLLRPLRDAYPEVAAVRELIGLCHYRLSNFDAAAKELDVFADLTGSVEQHPVLMDCARAKRNYRRVDELWRELADASPSGPLVTEGRIVLAGSLADRGRLRDAIATLERRERDVKRVQEHHLRVWYALADLSERAGDIPRARQLFLRIRKHEAGFADVAERLAALG